LAVIKLQYDSSTQRSSVWLFKFLTAQLRHWDNQYFTLQLNQLHFIHIHTLLQTHMF
jgi:hypothetical protein